MNYDYYNVKHENRQISYMLLRFVCSLPDYLHVYDLSVDFGLSECLLHVHHRLTMVNTTFVKAEVIACGQCTGLEVMLISQALDCIAE